MCCWQNDGVTVAITSDEGQLSFLELAFFFFFFFKRHITIITFPRDEIQSEDGYNNLKLV